MARNRRQSTSHYTPIAEVANSFLFKSNRCNTLSKACPNHLSKRQPPHAPMTVPHLAVTAPFRDALRACRICPRQCGVDRTTGADGFCRTDAGLHIAAITLHKGEEPTISGTAGICNVFFSHCNLRCLYCQNHQISRNESVEPSGTWTLAEATDARGRARKRGRRGCPKAIRAANP